MSTILLLIELFVTLALIGIVLIQRSEGGGLGIGGSQGMGSFMTGRGTANLLTRATAILATIFMVLAIAIGLLNRGGTGGSSILNVAPTHAVSTKAATGAAATPAKSSAPATPAEQNTPAAALPGPSATPAPSVATPSVATPSAPIASAPTAATPSIPSAPAVPTGPSVPTQ